MCYRTFGVVIFMLFQVLGDGHLLKTLASLRELLPDPMHLPFMDWARLDFARSNERLPVSPEAYMTSVIQAVSFILIQFNFRINLTVFKKKKQIQFYANRFVFFKKIVFGRTLIHLNLTCELDF